MICAFKFSAKKLFLGYNGTVEHKKKGSNGIKKIIYIYLKEHLVS